MTDFQGTMMPLSIISLFYVIGFPDHGFRGFHIAPINKHPFPNFFWIFLKLISHFYEEKVFCWGSLPELILPARRR